jgi:D-amino-acid oxidase
MCSNPAINPVSQALVIGAGVSGLTTALCLHRRGIRVTIAAEHFLSQTTSVVAGALWEWPPAVCGFHQNTASIRRSKAWARYSYGVFVRLSRQSGTGVSMRKALFYFRNPVKLNISDLRKMEEIQRNTLGFCHNADLIREHGVAETIGLRDAYTHLAPVVDTDRYMHWISGEISRAGIEVVKERIEGNLHAQQEEIKSRFGVDIVVNCSGLGARELVEPETYPLRGALIRIHNDGKAFPKINEAYCVMHDDALPGQNMIYIIPRGENFALLGGLAEPNEWDLSISMQNYEPIRRIWERCVEFLPRLKNAQIDLECPVKTGLRPMRPDNVRLEIDDYGIAHNYGHGGSGVTFSWGCAEELVTNICTEGMVSWASDQLASSPAQTALNAS